MHVTKFQYDVMLPNMDGLEVYKQIQAEGFQAGVCEYLSRPLANKEFEVVK